MTPRQSEQTLAKARTDVRPAARRRPSPRYVFRLYVTGTTQRSSAANANVRRTCEEHLPSRYDLAVIDIYQQPALARGDQITAVPTLIKRLPAPIRRLIGDLSDTERLLTGLGLRPPRS
jgi:circadian clock protein KaiB